MIHERIYLGKEKKAYIDTYVNTDSRAKARDAILIIPGGGYSHVCLDREGECVAVAYASRGVNAFLLNYRVGEGETYPNQLVDAAMAMAHIKQNSEKYHIDPDRVFAVGFSAGGHLCGTLATLYREAEELLGLPKGTARPRGVVLSYPVITALEPTHVGSFQNLLGKPFFEITEEEKKHLSIEENVTSDTPPAFIWHTAEDTVVPPIGSLRLAEAYALAGVAVELHLYPYGPHATATGTYISSGGNPDYINSKIAEWIPESVAFMKTCSDYSLSPKEL